MADSHPSKRGGEHVYDALVEAGIDLLVGIPGTQTLPLDRVVADRAEMQYVMARHETAVPHIAWGYFEASGTPAATLTVPGPGETNAMHGLKNAMEDSVPIVHVSADVDPDQRGKKPIHEIDPGTYDSVVKENVCVTSETDLPAALARGIGRALTPPMGPVRLGVPSGVLEAEFDAPKAAVTPETIERELDRTYDDAAALLANAQCPAILAGGGVRRSPGGPEALRALAADLDAPVAGTLKGKGSFPEADDRFLGVIGSHLPPGGVHALERADVVLALGTDFDGVTTSNWSVPMGETLIHVTLDPAAVDASYESDVALVADVTDAVQSIRQRLSDRGFSSRKDEGWDGGDVGSSVRQEYDDYLRTEGFLDSGPPLRTPGLLQTVRETIPDDSIVTVDIGGFRMWAMQLFETNDPSEFVAAGSWAGMGVGLPAAIGAQLAVPDKPVVCLSGDGGLLMCIHELHTAVEYDLPIVLIVSNNNDYGIISKSPAIREYTEDHAFTWDSPSFVTIAEGFGWNGQAVSTREGLAEAVSDAIDSNRPTLIDADVETDEPSAAEAPQFETDLEFGQE